MAEVREGRFNGEGKDGTFRFTNIEDYGMFDEVPAILITDHNLPPGTKLYVRRCSRCGIFDWQPGTCNEMSEPYVGFWYPPHNFVLVPLEDITKEQTDDE